jgi:hypothetical protein
MDPFERWCKDKIHTFLLKTTQFANDKDCVIYTGAQPTKNGYVSTKMVYPPGRWE